MKRNNVSAATKAEGTDTQPIDVSRYINRSVGQIVVDVKVIKLVDEFFANMSEGQSVTNKALVEFLVDNGIEIKNVIKTDVALNAVLKTVAYARGGEERTIDRVKSNPKILQSQWLYVRR